MSGLGYGFVDDGLELDPKPRIMGPQPLLTRKTPKYVYLAGHHMADEYRSIASSHILEAGHMVIDPMRDERDFRGIEDDNTADIVNGDLKDIVESDYVLANFSQNSVGTSMECWYAFSIHRPIVSFVDSEDMRISPWVHHISDQVHIGLDDAVQDLLWRLCFPSEGIMR